MKISLPLSNANAKSIIRLLTIGILLAAFMLPPPSQGMQLFSRNPQKKQFQEGVKQYNDQDYQQALQTFRELYDYAGFNPVATASHLMLVKSSQKVGLYLQSIRYGKEFLATYPSSSYVDDIYYAMAEAFIGLHQYQNAASYFVYSITQSSDEALARIALDQMLKVTDAFLSPDQVQSLVDGAIGRNERNLFQLAMLQEYIQSGEMSLASTTAMELGNSSLGDMLMPTFQALRKAIALDANKRVSIAVLAPLSGSYADIGHQLINGVRYALAQATDLPNVSIIPLDNRGSGLETVRQLERIIQHQRVAAVIGPVWSDNVVAGATSAAVGKVPLITPTATDNGLASLNRYVFQLNPDYETRGRAAAQFATDSLGLKLFATVSPADKQGKALTDAFTAEVERRGGDVVDQLWYTDKPEDLTDQWAHLRKIGFQLREQFEGGVDTSLIVPDSIRATLSDSEFVRLFRVKWKQYTEKVDSSKITLKYIDGMYFPIKNSDIDYIANQFAFYNFDTQVLGNVEWYDRDKLKQYSTYIDSMLIFSDYFIPQNSYSYQDFQAKFRQEMNTTPTALTLYGYDTMNLVLENIRKGIDTRESMAAALEKLHNVQGVARVITLDGMKPRVNQTLKVLQFTNQDLRLLDTLTVGPRKVHPLQSYFSE